MNKHLIYQRRRHIVASLAIFALNYGLDRFTKHLAEAQLKGRGALRFFHNIFVLTYAENTGAFLSMGRNWNMYLKYVVLLIIPIAICVAGLAYLMLKETRRCRIITGSCIIGGGIGNLADRLFNNFSVIDFMNFGIGPVRTGILNIADISVTFGVIIFMIFEFTAKPEKPEPAKD